VKLQRTHWLLAVFALFTAMTAWAFKPGPEIIRECPKCKVSLLQWTIGSGNTFGARFWTDGKMVAPMLPDRPSLVKCPKCGTLFWVNEAKELGRWYLWQEPRDDKDKKWANIVEPSLPSEVDLLNMLSTDKLSKEKELYVRRSAWWIANDAVRMNENATVSFSPAQEENLLALANLLDEKDPNQRIMKAEILRELGKFEECVKLLEPSFDNDYHTVAVLIKELAEQKSRLVRETKKDKKSKAIFLGK